MYGKKIGSDPYIFEDDFYVSNIMTANNLKPEKLEAITDVRDDLFYVTNAKQKKGGNILGSILGVLVGTALEAAFPSE